MVAWWVKEIQLRSTYFSISSSMVGLFIHHAQMESWPSKPSGKVYCLDRTIASVWCLTQHCAGEEKSQIAQSRSERNQDLSFCKFVVIFMRRTE